MQKVAKIPFTRKFSISKAINSRKTSIVASNLPFNLQYEE